MKRNDPRVIVCQGPPICDLEDDEAVRAQQRGCLWCRIITMHQDGSETVTEPARA